MIIVLDTNVLISSIIKDSTTRRLILESEQILLFPEGIFQEIRDHKEEILKKSRLTKEEYELLITKILGYVYIVPTELIIPKKEEAYQIVKDLDQDDILFFATALVFKGSIIWSNDKRLKKQNKVKILNTQEIIRLFKKH